MIPSPSPLTFSPVTVAGQSRIEQDLPETSKKANVDTYKTFGLDNREADGAAEKPLGAYSIQSSDDESEDNDIGILKLGLDHHVSVDMNRNVEAVELVNCLFLVHVPDNGETYEAWHIAGQDLYLLVHPKVREMSNPVDVGCADERADDWKKSVQKSPGTTYLCGPNADERARDFFNIDKVNVIKTEKGPVSVTFDIATRSFHPKYHESHKGVKNS